MNYLLSPRDFLCLRVGSTSHRQLLRYELIFNAKKKLILKNLCPNMLLRELISAADQGFIDKTIFFLHRMADVGYRFTSWTQSG
jgi:hypothetical protein